LLMDNELLKLLGVKIQRMQTFKVEFLNSGSSCFRALSDPNFICQLLFPSGEHQMELLDYVAAKFHEEAGIFKLLVQD